MQKYQKISKPVVFNPEGTLGGFLERFDVYASVHINKFMSMPVYAHMYMSLYTHTHIPHRG